MTARDGVIEVLEKLPERRVQQVLDFARHLLTQEASEGPAGAESLIQELEAIWARLPDSTGGRPYHFDQKTSTPAPPS